MTGQTKDEDRFDDEETRRRFEAALRGARAAETLQMKDIAPKRARGRQRQRLEETKK
jgi:hypothetical protein